MSDSNPNDVQTCPLCGGVNQCAVVAGGDIRSCWCSAVTMSEGVVEVIADEKKGLICVCADCAQRDFRERD